MAKNNSFIIAIIGFVFVLGSCQKSSSDDLGSGGLTPPPGFLERVDANCRAKEGLDFTTKAPAVRQLNGQTLLTYTLNDGKEAQCAVRHSDETVIDIRVIGAA